MMSLQKLKAMKYLKEEYKQLNNFSLLNLGVTVGLQKEGDFFHWKISMIGPQDTPYAGGFFALTADFPEDYPNRGPNIKFTNKIYHLNIRENGNINLTTLNNWKPGTSMTSVIASIFVLFYKQNPSCSYSYERIEQYKSNRDEFNKNAAAWTKKFAVYNNVDN